MAKLNKLSKMVASSKKNSVAEDFRNDLEYCIEQENKRDYIPSQSFKPSGISACKRSLFYELSGYKPDEEPPNTTLIGICESGTDRHEAIQNYVMQMKKHSIDCEWALFSGEETEASNASTSPAESCSVSTVRGK